jgi:hypothetical protein
VDEYYATRAKKATDHPAFVRRLERAGANAEQTDAPGEVDALEAFAGGLPNRLASLTAAGRVRSRVTVLKSSKRA